MSEWRRVAGFSRDLSLAVAVTDGVVGGAPVGDVRVRIEESDVRPIRNPSSYYLFFDLPQESVTVAVDGGGRYRDASTTVNLDPAATDTHDAGEAVEVSLEPTPAYPFPAGLTRVRGTLLDGETPVEGATVGVTGHSRTVTTTDAGEFVHYFDAIASADVEWVDPDPTDDEPGRRLYRPGGSDPTFEVSDSPDGSLGGFQTSVEVRVGTLTTHDLTY
ncbi:hypothetical protein [Salinigranum sp. GCM10025319]|uniref:hypothetical protein n=1 Tax=Salinigranum sp. GCM10025319 TaxID=3252687 RepID=UPI00361956D5